MRESFVADAHFLMRYTSCPDLIRASTIWTGRKKDVDGRDKPGHGEGPGEH
jgi:hypothetical protein